MKLQNIAASGKWGTGKQWALQAGSTLALSALLAGCGGSSPQSADNPAPAPDANTSANTTVAADKLTGAGATFPYPLYAKWFDTYNKNRGVQINYSP